MHESLVDIVSALGLPSQSCTTLSATLPALDQGAGLLILVTDLLNDQEITRLADWLAQRPASGRPAIILLVPDIDQAVLAGLPERLGGAVLLPETCSPLHLQSTIQFTRQKAQPETTPSALEPSATSLPIQPAIEAAQIGIWDYFPATKALQVDATCRMLLGLDTAAVLVLNDLLACLYPADRPIVEAAFRQALDPAGDGNCEIDFRTIGPDGSLRQLTASGRVRFANGQAVRFTGIVRDRSERHRYEEALLALTATLEEKVAERTARLQQANTERARAESQLQQSQKMEVLGQLTGGIAHDFNNLLSAVLGNLELLRSRLSDPGLQRFVENALQSVARGTRLTSQLLAFSRLHAVKVEPVDVNLLIEGLESLLVQTLGPEITIRTELSSQLPAGLADTNQLELSILNLAINARDAMLQNERVTVQRERTLTIATAAVARALQPAGVGATPCITISLRDTGSGMTPDVLGRVFEPFFTTKQVGKGTGLGLSQVQAMVQQCQGVVEIESRPGMGTIVTIFLPQATGLALPPPITEPELLVTGQGQSVLVVDDDPAVREALVDSLQLLGYKALVAADGPAALAILAAAKPPLAIVDYAFPGMNGAEWIVRARSLQPDLGLVLATGHAESWRLQAACPEAPLLAKPFRLMALGQALEQALGGPTLPKQQELYA